MLHTKIEVNHIEGHSRVTTMLNHKPLKILNPETHTSSCHLVTSNYGGGMVQGDSIGLDILCNANTRTLLSTQANSRVYKSDEDRMCHFTQQVDIHDQANFIQLNDPLVLQKDSSLNQMIKFNMEDSSVLLYCDWVTAGRVHFGELFDFSCYTSYLEINMGKKLLVADRFKAEPKSQDMTSPGSFSHHTSYANIYLVGASSHEAVEKLEVCLNSISTKVFKEQTNQKPDVICTADRINDNVFIVRMSVSDARDLSTLLLPIGAVLKDSQVLSFDPFERKY